MQIIETSPHNSRRWWHIASDDGRIEYWDCGFAAPWLKIDGRYAWHGVYLRDGRVTEEEPAPDLWQAACELMSAMRQHRDALKHEAEEARFARELAEDQRAERLAKAGFAKAIEGDARYHGGRY